MKNSDKSKKNIDLELQSFIDTTIPVPLKNETPDASAHIELQWPPVNPPAKKWKWEIPKRGKPKRTQDGEVNLGMQMLPEPFMNEIIYGSHECVQALMCGDVISRSALDGGAYRILLYKEVSQEKMIDLFDIERIECDGKQFEIAKSKIINSSFFDNCTPKDMFFAVDEILAQKESNPIMLGSESWNRIRHDKSNGIKLVWMLTNLELVESGDEWKDNVLESIVEFSRKLYPNASIDEETVDDLKRKYSEIDEAYRKSIKISEFKPKEELLKSFLEALFTALSGSKSTEPLIRFFSTAIDSEFDKKQMSNAWYIQNISDRTLENGESSEELDSILGMCRNIYRDGGFIDFEAKRNQGSRGYVEVFLKRLLYAVMYWFSGMQGSVKSRVFEMGERRNVSEYFWPNGWAGFHISYRERDGEGTWSFWSCVRLIRKIDWNLRGHFSEDLSLMEKDLLYKNEALKEELERNCQNIEIQKECNSLLESEKLHNIKEIDFLQKEVRAIRAELNLEKGKNRELELSKDKQLNLLEKIKEGQDKRFEAMRADFDKEYSALRLSLGYKSNL